MRDHIIMPRRKLSKEYMYLANQKLAKYSFDLTGFLVAI